MLVLASSFPSDLVSPMTAAFDALYALAFGLPSLPATEAMLTMRPKSCVSMVRTTSRLHRNTPWTLTSNTRCQASTGYSHSVVFGPVTPAEHTSASMRPHSAMLALVAASTLAPSLTSTTCVTVPLPMATAAFPSAAASRSHRLTRPPLATSLCATASPMPVAPPVTTAVRPAKSSRFMSPPVCCAEPNTEERTACSACKQKNRAGRIDRPDAVTRSIDAQCRASVCCFGLLFRLMGSKLGRQLLHAAESIHRRCDSSGGANVARRFRLVVPIRRRLVVLVDFGCPRGIRHRRPVILVEAWRILDALLAHIEHESLLFRVERQCRPWDREQLTAHAKETAVRQDRIRDAAGLDVDHDRL